MGARQEHDWQFFRKCKKFVMMFLLNSLVILLSRPFLSIQDDYLNHESFWKFLKGWTIKNFFVGIGLKWTDISNYFLLGKVSPNKDIKCRFNNLNFSSTSKVTHQFLYRPRPLSFLPLPLNCTRCVTRSPNISWRRSIKPFLYCVRRERVRTSKHTSSKIAKK